MRRSAALTIFLFTLAGCALPARDFGPWEPMQARQVGVPLAAGLVTVEVRDVENGWVERVEVESDGHSVLSGIPVESWPAGEPDAGGDAETAALVETDAGRAGSGSDLERAIALAVWTGHRTFGSRESDDDRGDGALPIPSEDAREILASVDRGDRFNCRSLASVLTAVARATGLRMRRIDLSVRYNSPYEGHSVAEVWSPEDGRWVLVDPWFGVRYEVDGRRAGAVDVHRAVVEHRIEAIRIVRFDGAEGVDPWKTKIEPLLYFRSIYARLSGGAWLRLVDDATPAMPVADVNMLQTDSEEAFASGGDPLAVAPLRRGSSHDRVSYQAVNGKLYVCLAKERFAYGRFEVRVTRGLAPTYTVDVAPHDPEDRMLVAPEELVPAPRPTDAGGDGVPDGWEIEGARPTVATTAEGATVESGDEGCILKVPVDFAGDAPVVAFARIRVDSGQVRFGVRNRRDGTTFVAEPGPSALFSSIVTPGRRPPIIIRFELEPRTRCVVEWISLRRARKLGEIVPGP